MKKIWLFLVIVITFSACTALTHDIKLDLAQEPRGFFWGLWHGVIAVFSFIWSLFDPKVAVYEVFNNGAWYDLGFLLGIGAFSSSAGRASKR
jgi:hypothetical protein